MNNQKDFDSYYQNKLHKRVEFLEEHRKKAIKKVKRNLIIAAFVLPLLVYSIVVIRHGVFIAAALIPFGFLIGYAYQNLIKTNIYLRRHYKKSVLQPAIHFYFEEFEYLERQKIAKDVLLESQLFPKNIGLIEGEDFMRFTLGQNQLMFCETYIQKNRQVVFKGVFITSTFNKYFNANTFIFPRKTKTFLKRIMKQLSRELEEVELEDIHFNRLFHTISSNQQEARYILTPVMMSNIIKYHEKLGMDANFSFVENRLYCSIPLNKDLFEPALFKPMNQDFVKKSFEPVLLFTDMVEDLDLNLRIWSKL